MTCDFVYLNFFIAPSQPPGNIMWNSSDSKIILNWDQVKALDNESEVKGYKVGNVFSAKAPNPPLTGTVPSCEPWVMVGSLSRTRLSLHPRLTNGPWPPTRAWSIKNEVGAVRKGQRPQGRV